MGKKWKPELPSPCLCYTGRQHNQKLGYGNISQAPVMEYKAANRSAHYVLSGKGMIRKIPKEHKGLYLCPPNNHGKQSKITEEDKKLFHDTLHKKGWERITLPLVQKGV